MKKLFLLVLLSASALFTKPRFLHISFHKGCINDMDEVAQELGIEVVSWHIREGSFQSILGTNNLDVNDILSGYNKIPSLFFDGKTTTPAIYNIGHQRAENIWNLHKQTFELFDGIITSDTGPLSRIFLQNGWKKPLIIWICNRFDYHDQARLDCRFPDREYYDLFASATKMDNVHIVSYTNYEHVYARRKGVEVGTLTINPIGPLPKSFDKQNSAIPTHINKDETLLLYPRLNGQHQVDFVQKQCAQVGVKTYHGRYNGPEDLATFKGVLYFPYAWSNLALFEDLQQGIIHFVPSPQFVKQLGNKVRHVTMNEFELCDWYNPEFRDLFVYFDSWNDLAHKVKNIDYQTLSKKIRTAGAHHRATMLDRWRTIFSLCSNES